MASHGCRTRIILAWFLCGTRGVACGIWRHKAPRWAGERARRRCARRAVIGRETAPADRRAVCWDSSAWQAEFLAGDLGELLQQCGLAPASRARSLAIRMPAFFMRSAVGAEKICFSAWLASHP